MPAPLPLDEPRRLEALCRYEVLDTLPEEAFDRVTRLTAQVLGVPIAIINFVDEHRQWGKSTRGTGSTEAARRDSFCAWTILSEDVLVVENAHEDERFKDNPQVTGAPFIHTYAGAPLRTPDGFQIGTLCVVSPTPHVFTEGDLRVLTELAQVVVDELELRLARRRLAQEAAAHRGALDALRAGRDHAETLAVLLASFEVDLLPIEAARLGAPHVGRDARLDWVGLATCSADCLHARTTWQSARASAAFGHAARQGLPFDEQVVARGRPAFWFPAPPAFADLGVRALAVVPLGVFHGSPHAYVAARFTDAAWTAADRQLLEAAASSVRVALERQESA